MNDNDLTFINYLNLLLSEKDTKRRINKIRQNNIQERVHYHKYNIIFEDNFEVWFISEPLGYRFICSPDFYDNNDTSDSLLTYDRICYYLTKLGERYNKDYDFKS